MGVSLTLSPGQLRVGAAFPDPPFDLPGDPPSGFDVALMQGVAAELGLHASFVAYQGDDFEGIFHGLAAGAYDAIASGTTVTAARRRVARFCRPYLRSGQSLVVDPARRPEVRSLDDLRGLTLGVQRGNTSEPVARRLEAAGKVGKVRIYPYHAILTALDDLATGALDAFMKLEPVMRWLGRDRPSLRIVQAGITEEELAVAVALDNEPLATAIDGAIARLAAGGTLAGLVRLWLGGEQCHLAEAPG